MVKENHKMSAAGVFLLLETSFVTVAVVWLIRFLRSHPIGRGGWLAVPLVLLSAAVIPTLLRRKNLSQIGLHMERLGLSLRALCWTCLVAFPLLFCGVFLLRYCQVPLPLCPVLPEKGWLSWLFYQFMYVAVAEEIFFRGYLLSNMSRLLTTTTKKGVAFSQLMSIIVSAGVFAIFHSVLLGNVVSLVTFFPGLILGWLFVKTGSLLAPVMFHGLANVGYGFIAAVMTYRQ